MTKSVEYVLLAAIAAAGTASGAAAKQPQFGAKPIVINGNDDFNATSVNAKGVIVGTLFDPTTGAATAEQIQHGTATSLPNPGGSFGAFAPAVINDHGDILGSAKNSSEGLTEMFLLQGGNFNSTYEEPLVEPGDASNAPPLPLWLTNNLKVSFNVIVSISGPIGTDFGRPPHLHHVPPQNRFTHINSINESSTVAGTSYSFNGITAVYLGQGKTYTTITPPNAKNVLGGFVNDSGVLAGSFEDTSNAWHGFTWKNGSFTTFDIPGATGKVTADAINRQGRVVGVYVDSSGNQHAFLWNGSAVSTFGKFGASDAVTVAIGNTGIMALSDQANGNGTQYKSYRVICSGTGC